MKNARITPPLVLLLAALALAGCESATEKAEEKYRNAVALSESGDIDRAMVELKSVFQLNGEHLEARMLYADLAYEAGNVNEAYGQYKLASQQFPNDLRPRVAQAQIALKFGEWDEVNRNLEAAKRIDPDSPRVQALELALNYRDALRDDQADAMEDLKTRAQALVDLDPENEVARSVLVDTLYQTGDSYAALEVLDESLAQNPKNLSMSQFKLRLLDQIGDEEGVGLHLRDMVKNFPENDDLKLYLVQWYVSKDDVASADAFLRAQFEDSDAIEPRVNYVQFKAELEGPEAAIATIDSFIAEGSHSDTFRMLRASSIFDLGRRDEAVAELKALTESVEPSDLLRDIQATLAQMLAAMDENAESEALIDAVLEADSRHVGALKLRANALVEQDRVGDAILALRTALDQAPYDADLYTLLAKAHEREGNRDLTGENLALAVQYSRAREVESLRYAQFLLADEKYASARDVLLQSLRRNTSSLPLLRLLSQVYIGMADWPRAEEIVRALRSVESEEAQTLANGLEATLMQRMQRTDESLELLRGMLSDGSTAMVARAAIIRTHLANGESEQARVFMDEALAQTPDDPGIQFLNAALLSVEGNFDQAIAVYRTLLEQQPESEIIWRAYVSNLIRSGDTEGSLTALDQALEVLPDSMNLLWMKASFEEQQGDYDTAIAIYEDLYSRQSGSTIVANNLASLISSHRTSEEELQRAYVIARRLKGSETPAFQDTYGWIAFRLGNVDEALTYLSAAAAGLPRDPLVQEHYALALVADDQTEEARKRFEMALQLLPETATDAKTRIEAAIAAIDNPAPPFTEETLTPAQQ